MNEETLRRKKRKKEMKEERMLKNAIEVPLAESLLASASMIEKNSGGPKDVWHPDFGWVLKDGKPTPASKAFWHFMRRKVSNE